MKNLLKIALGAIAAVLVMVACNKEAPLSNFKNAFPVEISLNRTSFAPTASDSDRSLIVVSFNNPQFATSSSNVKFITQIDLRGNNFADPFTTTVIGSRIDSIQVKRLNDFLLRRGIAFGAVADLQVRTIGSYANNNDQQFSQTLDLRVRAYKVPPRVKLPSTGQLFIVGGATVGGWNNPVPVPSQELVRLSETSWGGIFYLYGGGQYLILPRNGDWGAKYSVANTNLAGLKEGGAFGADLPGNFPGPDDEGFYKLTFDFQTGTFKVEKFEQQHGLPEQLVVVGGASPIGWNNNANNPQRFRRLNSVEWSIDINLNANDGYLVLPEPGNWGKKFGVPNRNLESARLAGPFVPEGQDFKSPLDAGRYRININFFTGQYSLTKL